MSWTSTGPVMPMPGVVDERVDAAVRQFQRSCRACLDRGVVGHVDFDDVQIELVLQRLGGQRFGFGTRDIAHRGNHFRAEPAVMEARRRGRSRSMRR